MQIRDKVILITGASGGIGAACARELERRGARLTLMARNGEALAKVCGPDVLRIQGDVTNEDDRRRAVEETVARFGRLDVLINNAGVGLYRPTPEVDIDAVRQLFELNLFGALRMVQLALPHLRQNTGDPRGVIVNMGSIAGMLPLPWFTMYSASKWALMGFNEALRIELKHERIGVMLMCPGYVKSGFQDNALSGRPPDRLWRMKRFATDVDAVALALARGLERNRKRVIVPRLGWLAAWRNVFSWPIDAILAHLNERHRHGE
ncbi:MAG: SDR family NAD(P)-dependent oxidoreductase [Bryobacterales bacterium]|nr:SDR family NAD(P)-dependent oxidoreductase [Bryobacterales bacterium]